jgi:hypothetical protein
MKIGFLSTPPVNKAELRNEDLVLPGSEVVWGSYALQKRHC